MSIIGTLPLLCELFQQRPVAGIRIFYDHLFRPQLPKSNQRETTELRLYSLLYDIIYSLRKLKRFDRADALEHLLTLLQKMITTTALKTKQRSCIQLADASIRPWTEPLAALELLLRLACVPQGTESSQFRSSGAPVINDDMQLIKNQLPLCWSFMKDRQLKAIAHSDRSDSDEHCQRLLMEMDCSDSFLDPVRNAKNPETLSFAKVLSKPFQSVPPDYPELCDNTMLSDDSGYRSNVDTSAFRFSTKTFRSLFKVDPLFDEEEPVNLTMKHHRVKTYTNPKKWEPFLNDGAFIGEDELSIWQRAVATTNEVEYPVFNWQMTFSDYLRRGLPKVWKEIVQRGLQKHFPSRYLTEVSVDVFEEVYQMHYSHRMSSGEHQNEIDTTDLLTAIKHVSIGLTSFGFQYDLDKREFQALGGYLRPMRLKGHSAKVMRHALSFVITMGTCFRRLEQALSYLQNENPQISSHGITCHTFAYTIRKTLDELSQQVNLIDIQSLLDLLQSLEPIWSKIKVLSIFFKCFYDQGMLSTQDNPYKTPELFLKSLSLDQRTQWRLQGGFFLTSGSNLLANLHFFLLHYTNQPDLQPVRVCRNMFLDLLNASSNAFLEWFFNFLAMYPLPVYYFDWRALDPYHEFFITYIEPPKKEELTEDQIFWKFQFQLSTEQKCPDFFPAELAHSILLAGKLIQLIEAYVPPAILSRSNLQHKTSDYRDVQQTIIQHIKTYEQSLYADKQIRRLEMEMKMDEIRQAQSLAEQRELEQRQKLLDIKRTSEDSLRGDLLQQIDDRKHSRNQSMEAIDTADEDAAIVEAKRKLIDEYNEVEHRLKIRKLRSNWLLKRLEPTKILKFISLMSGQNVESIGLPFKGDLGVNDKTEEDVTLLSRFEELKLVEDVGTNTDASVVPEALPATDTSEGIASSTDLGVVQPRELSSTEIVSKEKEQKIYMPNSENVQEGNIKIDAPAVTLSTTKEVDIPKMFDNKKLAEDVPMTIASDETALKDNDKPSQIPEIDVEFNPRMFDEIKPFRYMEKLSTDTAVPKLFKDFQFGGPKIDLPLLRPQLDIVHRTSMWLFLCYLNLPAEIDMLAGHFLWRLGVFGNTILTHCFKRKSKNVLRDIWKWNDGLNIALLNTHQRPFDEGQSKVVNQLKRRMTFVVNVDSDNQDIQDISDSEFSSKVFLQILPAYPLSIVVSSQSLSSYSNIFSLLLAVQYRKSILDEQWIELKEKNLMTHNYGSIYRECLHFMNTLGSYLDRVAIAETFHEYRTRLSALKHSVFEEFDHEDSILKYWNIHRLQQMHTYFVDKLLYRLFLHPQMKPIYKLIAGCLVAVQDLTSFAETVLFTKKTSHFRPNDADPPMDADSLQTDACLQLQTLHYRFRTTVSMLARVIRTVIKKGQRMSRPSAKEEQPPQSDLVRFLEMFLALLDYDGFYERLSHGSNNNSK